MPIRLLGFLRATEVLNLRPCDCEVSAEMMTVRITGSKTDQLRQGDEVLLARMQSCTCPVAQLEKFMAVYYIPRSDLRFILRPIQKTKNGEVLGANSPPSDPLTIKLLLNLYQHEHNVTIPSHDQHNLS